MKVMTNSCALAHQAAFAAEKEVLRQLLGDGRAADDLGRRRAAGFGCAAARFALAAAPLRLARCVDRARPAPAFWLRSQAFSSASHSTPLCSAKPASSEAITARFRLARCARRRPTAGSTAAGAFSVNEPPGLRALEGGRLRIDDRHQRDARQKVQLQRQCRQQHQRREPAEARQRLHAAGSAMRARSAASTGAVSGRTPRQSSNASAACSTSMPRPSRPRAPCAAAQARKPWRSGPVHHVEGQRAWCEHAGRYRHGRALQAAGGGVDDDIEAAAAPESDAAAARRAVAPRRAVAFDQRAAPWRSVRLATTSSAGRAASKGPSTPAAAPPAPISSTRARAARRRRCARCRAPGRRRRCCRRASRSASKRSVLQACAPPRALAERVRRGGRLRT